MLKRQVYINLPSLYRWGTVGCAYSWARSELVTKRVMMKWDKPYTSVLHCRGITSPKMVWYGKIKSKITLLTMYHQEIIEINAPFQMTKKITSRKGQVLQWFMGFKLYTRKVLPVTNTSWLWKHGKLTSIWWLKVQFKQRKWHLKSSILNINLLI